MPYLLARPGIEIAEAAADLGVTERQLREDLELLWVCGLPGYGPGDLIDMAFDGDRVTITYDAGIDRPLRLTPDEALALVVALRMLAETPGRGQPGRGRAGPGQDRERGRRPGRRAGGGAAARRTPTGCEELRAAVERGRALRITYYTAARDETTERVVDPMRVLMVGGRAYLEAWCRRAEAVRLFRVDRIDAFTELDEPAVPPPQARAARRQRRRVPARRRTCRWSPCGSAGASGGSPSTTRASGSRRDGDQWLVSLRVTDLGWARRFVLGLGPDVTVVAPAGAGRAGPRAGGRRARRVRRPPVTRPRRPGGGRGHPVGWPPW